jgi:hypothetical protein
MMDESDGVVNRRKRRTPAKKKDETSLYLLQDELRTSGTSNSPPAGGDVAGMV